MKSGKITPLVYAHYTEAHEQHPERNEDCILVDRQRGLAAVFDGVGGSDGGEDEDALRIDQATESDQLTEIEREIFNKRNGITQSLGHLTHKKIPRSLFTPTRRLLNLETVSCFAAMAFTII